MNPTPIITLIDKATRDIPGWTPIDQLLTLYTLAHVTSHLGGDILEIGSWCGRSSVVLGMAAQASCVGKVHCVDVFPELHEWFENQDGTFSFKAVREAEICLGNHTQTVWSEPFQRDIVPTYERFGSIRKAFNTNIRENNLEDYINVFDMSSKSFALKVSGKLRIRLAFIDADHSYEAVTDDIHHVEKLLISGGWICFDDAFSSYDGVNRAITEHIIENANYQSCAQVTRKMFIARRI